MGDPTRDFTIKADYSTILSWNPVKTDNSHIPSHAIIEVFIIYSNWRDVQYKRTDKNGNECYDLKRIYDVEARHYIGGTNDPGRSHNHVFLFCATDVITLQIVAKVKL